jgi:hypothetical protein
MRTSGRAGSSETERPTAARSHRPVCDIPNALPDLDREQALELLERLRLLRATRALDPDARVLVVDESGRSGPSVLRRLQRELEQQRRPVEGRWHRWMGRR